MNFSKHNNSARFMAYDISQYCRRIFRHRRKSDDRYKGVSTSVYSDSAYVYHRDSTSTIDRIMTIYYDERYGLYYFLEFSKYKNKRVKLETRIYIKSKKEFYSYFDYKLEEYFESESLN